MARLAYLQRVAYGRSSHEHPPRSDASRNAEASGSTDRRRRSSSNQQDEASQRAAGTGSTSLYEEYVQRFNDRGHPFNPESRAHGRAMRTAANDVLSVIGIVEKSDDAEQNEHVFIPDSRVSQASDNENLTGDIIAATGVIVLDATSWWLVAFLNRLLVFPPQQSLSLVGIMSSQSRSIGLPAFLFAGLPSLTTTAVLGPSYWKPPILYQVDRLVMATVSTRSARMTYNDWIRPQLSGLIEFGLQVVILPFRLHSSLQTLGLIPFGWWTVFPHWRRLIPFAYDHPLRPGRITLPILAMLFYYALAANVHDKVGDLLAILRLLPWEDEDDAKPKKPSGQLYLAPHESPTLMLGAFQIVAEMWESMTSWLGNHPSQTPTEHDSVDPSTRTELTDSQTPPRTQHQDSGDSLSQTTPPPNSNTHTPENSEDHGAGEDDTRDSNGEDNNGERRPNAPDSPTIPSTTIRISSYDSSSGVVNLEIGVPEETAPSPSVPLSRQDPASPTIDPDHPSYRDPSKYWVSSYRVSSLSSITSPMYALVMNNFIAGVILMPFKTVMLRSLCSHYMSQHGLSLDPGYTTGLWSEPARWRGVGTRGLGGLGAAFNYSQKILLCYTLDMALGIAYTHSEWLLIRWIGIRWFNWGRL